MDSMPLNVVSQGYVGLNVSICRLIGEIVDNVMLPLSNEEQVTLTSHQRYNIQTQVSTFFFGKASFTIKKRL